MTCIKFDPEQFERRLRFIESEAIIAGAHHVYRRKTPDTGEMEPVAIECHKNDYGHEFVATFTCYRTSVSMKRSDDPAVRGATWGVFGISDVRAMLRPMAR